MVPGTDMVDGSSALMSSGGSGSIFWSPQALYSVHLHVVKTPIHTLKINKSLNTVECGDVCLCFQHLGGRGKQIFVALPGLSIMVLVSQRCIARPSLEKTNESGEVAQHKNTGLFSREPASNSQDPHACSQL